MGRKGCGSDCEYEWTVPSSVLDAEGGKMKRLLQLFVVLAKRKVKRQKLHSTSRSFTAASLRKNTPTTPTTPHSTEAMLQV